MVDDEKGEERRINERRAVGVTRRMENWDKQTRAEVVLLSARLCSEESSPKWAAGAAQASRTNGAGLICVV